MGKKVTRDWSKLANSPDFEDTFDELYEEEVVNESKQRKKDHTRFDFQED